MAEEGGESVVTVVDEKTAAACTTSRSSRAGIQKLEVKLYGSVSDTKREAWPVIRKNAEDVTAVSIDEATNILTVIGENINRANIVDELEEKNIQANIIYYGEA